MNEYPSIVNSRKIPEVDCITFDKIDGSNFRAKWSFKTGFKTFGTRTQLVDENTDFWGKVVRLFKQTHEEKLHEVLKNKFEKERQVIVFSEFYGDSSFAGRHSDEPHRLVTFDLLLDKTKKFLLPQDFINTLDGIVEIPKVIYEGPISDEFITDVRNGNYNVVEGVICKGTQRYGNYSGGVLMCKIKTHAYLEKLKTHFKDEWMKYAE